MLSWEGDVVDDAGEVLLGSRFESTEGVHLGWGPGLAQEEDGGRRAALTTAQHPQASAQQSPALRICWNQGETGASPPRNQILATLLVGIELLFPVIRVYSR